MSNLISSTILRSSKPFWNFFELNVAIDEEMFFPKARVKLSAKQTNN